MNTKELQKKFTIEYKKFFGENNIIVSVPFVINRGGDVIPNYSGTSIKQKIPLRMYIGLAQNTSPHLQCGNITYYHPQENTMHHNQLVYYAPYFFDLESYLKKHFPDLQGYTINILSELPRTAGLGFNSNVSLGVATAISLLMKKIDSEKINKIQSLPIQENLEDTKSGVREIFNLAMDIETIITKKTLFGTKICSFFDSYYPTFSFKEDKIQSNNQINRSLYGYRFDEVWTSLEKIPYTPFDLTIIYSGIPYIAEQINFEENYHEGFHKTKKFLDKKLSSIGGSHLPAMKPKFIKRFIEPEHDVINEVFGNLMGAINMECLHSLIEIFSRNYSDHIFKHFIDVLNKIRLGHIITRKNSSLFLSFINNFLGVLGDKSNDLAIVSNDTTIMGGSVLIVSPMEAMRGFISQGLSTIAEKNPGVVLLYNNRQDGIESRGVMVEQHIEDNIFSPLIREGSCILKKSLGGVIVGEQSDLIDTHTDDILLDCLSGKIYLGKEKITSQEIHSQNTTVDIVTQLLESPENTITNKDIPLSSYSKNKNEMISKIIIPLKKIIKKRLNKSISLDCHGNLSQFTIKLETSNVSFSIIKKI